MKGAKPRDFDEIAVGSMAGSQKFGNDIQRIPRDQWSQLLRQQTENGMLCSQIRNRGNAGKPIPSQDQNGQGFCWAYSPTAAAMVLRASAGMPYVELSAHSVACKIYNFQDRGAWNPLAFDFIREFGVAPASHWSPRSMDRSNDNSATWEAASNFRFTEGWIDIDASAAYDKNLAFDEIVTCLLLGLPCPVDFQWWGHSVLALDLVEVNRGFNVSDIRRWGLRIWNSWTDNWGNNGTGVIQGEKCYTMGASCPRSMTLAA